MIFALGVQNACRDRISIACGHIHKMWGGRKEEKRQQHEKCPDYFFLLASSSSFCKCKVAIRTEGGRWSEDMIYLCLADFADTLVSLPGASVAQCPVCLELAFFGSDFAGSLVGEGGGEGDGNAGGRSSEVIALDRKEAC